MADRTPRIFANNANNPTPPSPTGMSYGVVANPKVNPVVQKAISIPGDAAAVIKKAEAATKLAAESFNAVRNLDRNIPWGKSASPSGEKASDNIANDENNATAELPSVDESMTADGYRVRLYAVKGFPQGERVIFDVTPTLSESRTVDYNTVAPIHLPGSIQAYKRTSARTFSLGVKLISRNQEQATANIASLQLLRGWCMPYFGLADQAIAAKTGAASTSSQLGAPPDVLYLYAYSSGTGGSNRVGSGPAGINIKKIPVVVTSLGIEYPEDCDYIPTVHGDPFPVIMNVKIELIETHATGGKTGYERFSLDAFKNGRLVEF